MNLKSSSNIEKEGWVKFFDEKGKKKTAWATLKSKHLYLFHSKRKLEVEQIASIRINEKTKISLSKGTEKLSKNEKKLEIQNKADTFSLILKPPEDTEWQSILTQKIEEVEAKVKSKINLKNTEEVVKVTKQGDTQSRTWTVEQKLEYLRKNTIGRNVYFKTPYMWDGVREVKNYTNTSKVRNQMRMLVYEDFTASGRALHFVENYIQEIMVTYANTHTEINATGSATSQHFEKALETILKHVRAPPDYFVIPVGAGVTAAIEKLHKILGLYVTQKQKKLISPPKVVAFVSPYEHHSNDISWQESTICEFVRIKPTPDFLIDISDLEEKLKTYSEKKYTIIASFSACSNVTGTITDIRGITSLVKKYKGIVCFDYAASGPYVDINMTRDGMDAIFLSPHKNLGGPGSCGILVGNPALYDLKSPPSFSGGGTVEFVTPYSISYHKDIVSRELAGTPPVRGVFLAALSLQVKEWFGMENIEEIEAKYCKEFMDFFCKHPRFRLFGNDKPENRIPILSFMFKHHDKYLHQHFSCALLNDMFGIQARSGCSCAGPWGHSLLELTKEKSFGIMDIIMRDFNALKPGWVRLGLHYTMTREEFEYTKFALNGLAWFGHLFLQDYLLDVHTGTWVHKTPPSNGFCFFGVDDAIKLDVSGTPMSRMYIPAQTESEEERNSQLILQEEEFIRIVSFKIMQIFCPPGSVELYNEIFPIIKKFLCSYLLDNQGMGNDLTAAILKITAYKESEVKKIMENEILVGNFYTNNGVFPPDVNKMSFFYCASGNAACMCGKKGQSDHESIEKLTSVKGSRGSFF